MQKTKKAMQKQGLKYFSSLTPLQKYKTVNNIRIIKNQLENLPFNLAMEILKNLPFESVIKENDFINNHLKGQKMFFYKKLDCYIPLNINQIINNS